METAASIAMFLANVICPSLDDVLEAGTEVFTRSQRQRLQHALENLEELYEELRQQAEVPHAGEELRR